MNSIDWTNSKFRWATYIIVRRALFCNFFFLLRLFLDLLLDPLEASRGATL
jgi:hypothetical protein